MAGMGTEVGRISIKVVPDMDGFREKVRAALTGIKDAEVEVKPKGIEEAKAKIDNAARDREAKIKVDVDESALSRFKERWRNLFSREKIKVDVEVSKDSAAKAQKDIVALGKGGGKGANIGDVVPKFGSGLNPAAYVAILAGISLYAAPLIGLVTTALLTLPGLIGLVAAPIAAITLGLDGLKKAAETIKPQFDSLKETMSKAAEDTFTPVLKNLADNVFPILKESLPSVTEGLGKLADSAVNALKDPGNKLGETIKNIGASLGNMGPGIDGFVSGFTQLANQFSLKLPAISEWFNKAGQDFSNWIAKISANGQLSQAFDNLGSVIKTVLDLIGQFATKGFDTAAMKGGVDSVKGALEGLGKVINDVLSFSKMLNEQFQKLGQIARVGSILGDVLSGDLGGAFKTGKQLFTNEDIVQGVNGANQVKDAVTGIGTSAAESKAKLQDMMTGGLAAAPTPGSLGEALFGPAGAGGAAGKGPVVAVPDTAPAEAKVTEYQSFIDSVTQQVRGSLTQATSGQSLPAPDFSAFKAAWSELPTFITGQLAGIGAAAAGAGAQVSSALSVGMAGAVNIVRATFTGFQGIAEGGMAGLVGAVTSGTAQAVAVLGTLPGQIAAIGSQLFAAAQAAGAQVGAGMAAGITASIGQAVAAASALANAVTAAAQANLGIKSPSKVFHGIGENTVQGFTDGLDQSKEQAIASATSLAEEVSKAMEGGVVMPDFKDRLKKSMAELELQKADLKTQINALPEGDKEGKASLRAQQKQLQTLKDQLSLQSKQLGYSKEYGDQTEKTDDVMGQSLDKLMQAASAIGMGTYKQFASDIGISGQGSLSQALDQGLQFGMSMLSKAITGGGGTTINVGSVDDALAAKRNEDSKQAMQFAGR